jgi:hypothetical protein
LLLHPQGKHQQQQQDQGNHRGGASERLESQRQGKEKQAEKSQQETL